MGNVHVMSLVCVRVREREGEGERERERASEGDRGREGERKSERERERERHGERGAWRLSPLAAGATPRGDSRKGGAERWRRFLEPSGPRA